jgi:hypothetical protein
MFKAFDMDLQDTALRIIGNAQQSRVFGRKLISDFGRNNLDGDSFGNIIP